MIRFAGCMSTIAARLASLVTSRGWGNHRGDATKTRYLASSSSTSNTSEALGGITLPAPRAPYPKSGGSTRLMANTSSIAGAGDQDKDK